MYEVMPVLGNVTRDGGRSLVRQLNPEAVIEDTTMPVAVIRTERQREIRGLRAVAPDGAEHGREELRTLRQQLFARGEPAPRILQQGLVLLEETDLRDELPRLSVPSLWISGRRDRLVPPTGMRAAAALAPHSEFLEIPGGGHAPFLGHADEVAQAIDAFASASSRHSREGGNPAALDSTQDDKTVSPRTGTAEGAGFPPSRE